MTFIPSRPALSRTVLCLTLLISSAGFAQASQDAAPPAPVPTEETAPPPLVPVTESPEQPPAHGQVFPRESQEDTGTDSFHPRLLLLPVPGFFTAGVAGFASIVPSFLLTLPFCKGSLLDDVESRPCDIALYTGMTVGAAFGASLGVYAVGKLMGEQGRFWHTLLGALAGTASGFVMRAATHISDGLFIGILLGGQAIGATVAYAISDAYSPTPQKPAPRAASGFSVLPVVSATQTGGLVGGLVGRF